MLLFKLTHSFSLLLCMAKKTKNGIQKIPKKINNNKYMIVGPLKYDYNI